MGGKCREGSIRRGRSGKVTREQRARGKEYRERVRRTYELGACGAGCGFGEEQIRGAAYLERAGGRMRREQGAQRVRGENVLGEGWGCIWDSGRALTVCCAGPRKMRFLTPPQPSGSRTPSRRRAQPV